jgi:hypothetical protein
MPRLPLNFGGEVAAPLISLSEPLAVDQRATWTVYVGDDEPRHVPQAVQAAGRWVRHVLVVGPFGVQFWYQSSHDGDKWLWVQQTG